MTDREKLTPEQIAAKLIEAWRFRGGEVTGFSTDGRSCFYVTPTNTLEMMHAIAAALRTAEVRGFKAGQAKMRERVRELSKCETLVGAAPPYDALAPQKGEYWPHVGWRIAAAIDSLSIEEADHA